MAENTSTTHKPFKIIAFGDSVMWGQGLAEHEKIHALVAAALQERLPSRAIELIQMAHSGAIIGDPDDINPPPPLTGELSGEVPFPRPTVFEQLHIATNGERRDESVDLVLVCAGINDVDLTYILNPLYGAVDARIEDVFYRRSKSLMEALCGRYPKAIVVFTGYYPFLSSSTEQQLFGLAIMALGFGIAGVPGVVGGLILDALTTDEIVARAERFYKYAHAELNRAMNDTINLLPHYVDRLFFADPDFQADNAIFAPNTLLYGINGDFSPHDPEPIASKRAQACEENAPRLPPAQQVGCSRASLGHPTPNGARKYADAFMAQIRFALPKLFIDG
jgi:hypothetical protein